MKEKYSYKNVIVFSIFIGILLLIILINPHIIQKNYFNESYNKNNFEEIDLSTNYKIMDYIESRTRYLSESVVTLKQGKEINDKQSDEVIKISSEAQRELSSYKTNNDENSLYKSLFLTNEALSYKKAYPFINCANEVYNFSKKYHWLFYYLNYNDKERVSDVYNTRTRLENFLEYITSPTHLENKDKIISLAKEVENLEQTFNLYKFNCDQFKTYLYEDYNKQNDLFLIKLLSVISVFLAGLIFGITLSKRKTLEKRGDTLINKIKEIFSPKEIKEKTIDSILKISSVTTALVAILGIALNSFLDKIIAGIILISVLSSLSSILLGVIALNNEQENYKKWSYRTFVFGLFFFIIFFAYLIIGGIFTKFIKALGESAISYFNSTGN